MSIEQEIKDYLENDCKDCEGYMGQFCPLSWQKESYCLTAVQEAIKALITPKEEWYCVWCKKNHTGELCPTTKAKRPTPQTDAEFKPYDCPNCPKYTEIGATCAITETCLLSNEIPPTTIEILMKQGMTSEEAEDCIEKIKLGITACNEGKVRPWSEIREELGLIPKQTDASILDEAICKGCYFFFQPVCAKTMRNPAPDENKEGCFIHNNHSDNHSERVLNIRKGYGL